MNQEAPLAARIHDATAKLVFEASQFFGATRNFEYGSPDALREREVLFGGSKYRIRTVEERVNRPNLFITQAEKGIQVEIICGPSTDYIVVESLRQHGISVTQSSIPFDYDFDIIDKKDLRLARKSHPSKTQFPEAYMYKMGRVPYQRQTSEFNGLLEKLQQQ